MRPTGNLTVAAIWEAYRKALGDRPTAKTMLYTGKAILPHFGALRPDQIGDDDCLAYAAARRANGIGDGSILTELGHLRSALVWAARPGRGRMIPEAPAILRPQKPAPKDRWLDEGEIARLLAAAETPHIGLAIILMLASAGRVGAILDLTWARVDFAAGQIDLRLDAEGPRKGRAVVPMNRMARAALLSAREAALSDHVIEWAGGPVRCILKGVKSAGAAAKLAGVTPHVLRHTAAVHMAKAGVPMEKIAQYLGHSNVATTRAIYARFAPDHLRDAAEALEFGGLTVVK